MSSQPWKLLTDRSLSIISNKIEFEPGVYLLKKHTKSGKTKWYVGRSDDDLFDRLGDHVGVYLFYKYWIRKTKKDAYEGECKLFHQYKEFCKHNKSKHIIGNKNHPHKLYISWSCPICGK